MPFAVIQMWYQNLPETQAKIAAWKKFTKSNTVRATKYLQYIFTQQLTAALDNRQFIYSNMKRWSLDSGLYCYLTVDKVLRSQHEVCFQSFKFFDTSYSPIVIIIYGTKLYYFQFSKIYLATRYGLFLLHYY